MARSIFYYTRILHLYIRTVHFRSKLGYCKKNYMSLRNMEKPKVLLDLWPHITFDLVLIFKKKNISFFLLSF